ncbi:MAG: flagellar basal body P-ring protein FlgI [Planctomycetes bacterium]|nr:flagellar basal body P-ring protein FlgI [Planctomycetota bacterium]
MAVARQCLTAVITCAVIALGANYAQATSIQDLIRIKGHEKNVLTGLGIVIGLDGTGDESKKSLIAARPYAQLLRNLGNPVSSLEELAKADSFALVTVTMVIPATGVREGDQLDVSVDTMFNAESLEGGRLFMSPLRLPLPDSEGLQVLAIANGPVVIEGSNPRSGKIRSGGKMLVDIRTHPVSSNGVMGLVLNDHYAGYPNSTMIANAINEEFALDGYPDVAVAEDAKNVKILLPPGERQIPANFIATLLTIQVDPSLIQSKARIVINERQGIIAISGNVAISPIGIAHRGLSITTITPVPAATIAAPIYQESRYVGMDTSDGTSRTSTRLQDLLAAFDQLKVPVEDQIAIIFEMKKTGALHAEIITQ